MSKPLDVLFGVWLSRFLATVALCLLVYFVRSRGEWRLEFLLCSGSFFLASKIFEEMDDA